MRLALHILGREVLAVDVHHEGQTDEPEPELGQPFGFSGGAGGQIERADDWTPLDDRTHERPTR